MSTIKKSNRGGARPGAGRKPAFRTESDGTIVNDYKPKVNPVKELEKLYKELNKVKTKDELIIVQAKIDLLNKLLPYVAYKKPTASLEDNQEKIPEMTVITVKDSEIGEPSKKEEQKTKDPKDEGDFV